jgi:HlyD family secretion protein
MEVVAEVYETDIGRIRIGQPVTVTAENGGFSGTLTGRVSRIGGKIGKKDVLSTDPTADVDARVVEVHVELAPRDRQRVANLTNLQVMVRINAAANQTS